MKRCSLSVVCVAMTLATLVAQAGQAGGDPGGRASRRTARILDGFAPAGPYADTTAGRARAARGYLVSDPEGYDRAKAVLSATGAGAEGGGGQVGQSTPAGPSAQPVAFKSWKGVNDTSVTPGDSTGAVGPSRYVELVNVMFGIYDRSGSRLASGPLSSLTGDTTGSLTDPQVMWDPGTGRFYYVVLDASSNLLDVGFSTGDSPAGASDWCKYQADFGYGSNLPDYPKLGDSRDFLVIGVNVFDSAGSFLRSDADWMTKPGPGTSCPSGSSFTLGTRADLRNADGSQTSTPVPASQTDAGSQGWIVAAKDTTLGSGKFVSIFSITRNPDGTANIQGTATSTTVSSYSLPPPAPQSGTTKTFDTLDGRLTQAVSAVDPSRGSVTAVWTQHTVAGGAGSEVRWYEIDPSTAGVLQSGSATSTSIYAFNGGIAPDRAVSGAGAGFGDSMVLMFDTSSTSVFEAIQMVSKVGRGTQSAFVLVKQSAGKDADFSCSPVCRWGDYAGASPDPAAPLGGAHGQVWCTNTWNVSSTNNTNVDWRTQNVGVNP